MDACDGSVVLGMVVRAFNVYAPLCINAKTFTMFAASIASGRNPSKLTINTREIGGVGVNVIVGGGISVAGGGVLLETGVAVMMGGTTVGGGGEATDPHDDRKITRRVKYKIRRNIFRMISQASAFSTRDVLRRQWQFHNPHQRVVPRPCLDLLSGLFAI
jgi:hypothetical protein